MTDDERLKRVRKFLATEASQPLTVWWLSFADPDLEDDQQFLGACLVKAKGPAGAVRVSHELGINPGGQVEAVGGIVIAAAIEAEWTNRLLTKPQCEELNRLLKPSVN